MQFMFLLERRAGQFSEADFAAHLPAEGERARALHAEGFIRQIWHRGDAPGVCILAEAASGEAAREALATLPLVAAGMLAVTMVPLTPYRGFGPRAG